MDNDEIRKVTGALDTINMLTDFYTFEDLVDMLTGAVISEEGASKIKHTYQENLEDI